LGIDLDLPAVFVDEAMVISAEQDQILQIGETEIGPMFAVMDVEEVSFRTAGEPAASIPEPELPSQPGGDEPGPASDTEDPAMIGDDTFDEAITGQSSGGFAGDDRTGCRFGDTGRSRSANTVTWTGDMPASPEVVASSTRPSAMRAG
jgi:hypothetical protein